MVLLSITPLLDGVLRRDIIAPFHTSGPPLLQFHLAIEQWGKPTVRGNNIFPIPFPNSALAITSAGIGGWHTVDVSIVNNNSYSVLGWATDSPSTARTSLPNVIAIGF